MCESWGLRWHDAMSPASIHIALAPLVIAHLVKIGGCHSLLFRAGADFRVLRGRIEEVDIAGLPAVIASFHELWRCAHGQEASAIFSRWPTALAPAAADLAVGQLLDEGPKSLRRWSAAILAAAIGDDERQDEKVSRISTPPHRNQQCSMKHRQFDSIQ